VDLSGIIFVVLALAWAVYLIPKAVKHHDEVARTRSVDRFSTAMRVLARREPIDRGNARLVVTPPRSTDRVLLPSRPAAAADEPTASPQVPRRSVTARRAAARAAARRRRHVTFTLLAMDLVVLALAASAIAPWWSVAVPATLTLLYLVLCRRQVSRESQALWTPEAAPAGPARPAIRVDAPSGSLQAPSEQPSAREAEFAADEDTVQIPVAELETVAVSVEAADGSSLWDPLPVTLPTYVNKARAPRTVRTIDLGAPDTWTSGRDEADSALVESSAAEEQVEETVEHEPWRAVGS